MSLLQIAEVFGHDTSVPRSENERRTAYCPFLEKACTKQNRTNPLGICSYTDGINATIVCPARFREDGRILVDAARAAFGSGRKVITIPEFQLLVLPDSKRKIGKIDYVMAVLNQANQPVDFAAVEVQAVYVSGKSSRAAFEHYLRTGGNHANARRRPDYLSSAQKRLMPQLSLKVPVFRRWGKRFFVVVDASFFAELPKLRSIEPDSSEITWLVYPFSRQDDGFHIGEPSVFHTQWDDVVTALREGNPPTKEGLLEEFNRPSRRLIKFQT